MKNTLKKLSVFVLAIVMVMSVLPISAFAAEKNVYHYGNHTAEKLSNPTTGEREVDGLEEGGDRKNSYAWSMERLTDSNGDYVYIGSNCNILYAVVGGSLSSGVGIDTEIVDALVNAVTNGEIDPSIKGLDMAQAAIVRYNLKTGEMETWFDSADYGVNPSSPFSLVSGFRAVKSFKGDLYFNANSSIAGSYFYRISSNDQTEPEVVFSSNGNGFMRSMTVSEDGNTLYIGGTLNMMEGAVDNQNDYEIVVYKTTSGDKGSFEPIADAGDFARYKKAAYRSSGGDVWDMVEYKGDIYFTLMTTKGGMVFKGHEDKSDPNANQYGWVWEEFAGEEETSPYGAGFGNAMNYALTPYVFNGDLYFIGFSNAMDAMMYGTIGLLQYMTGATDINGFFDSLKDMDAVMENETAVFRYTEDGQMQMVVGDEVDCPDNIQYVAKMQAGFNDASRSTTNYNWRAAIYNGKFYIGTFDSYPMFKYLTKLTNGDLLNMSDEEFRSQLEYLKTFIEIIMNSAHAEEEALAPVEEVKAVENVEEESDPTMVAIQDVAELYENPVDAGDEAATAAPGANITVEELEEAAIERLFDLLVRLQQNVDKEATTEFLSDMLLSIPEAAEELDQLFDQLTELQKLGGKAHARYIGVVKSIVAAVRGTLDSVDPEGLERYVRISNTIAANDNPGFELYGTEDGINYETVTLNGFNDEYNYGCRTLLTVDDGLLVGTANPFFGAQLWKVTDSTAPIRYTVTFDMGGHGTAPADQKVESGSTAVKPADPAESGYTFEGWYADADFHTAFDFDAAITADTTVYAKWAEVKDVDPVDPVNPTDPTDPTDPVNPADPVNPTNPTDAQTGDNSHVFLWLAFLFVSGSVLVGTTVFRKKKNYRAD